MEVGLLVVVVKSIGRREGAFMPRSSRSKIFWGLGRLVLLEGLAVLDSSFERSSKSFSISSSLSIGSPLPGTPSPRPP